MLEAPLDAAQELESSGNLAEVPGSDGTGRSDRRRVLKQNPVCLIPVLLTGRTRDYTGEGRVMWGTFLYFKH